LRLLLALLTACGRAVLWLWMRLTPAYDPRAERIGPTPSAAEPGRIPRTGLE
jgi:hypothetical protein